MIKKFIMGIICSMLIVSGAMAEDFKQSKTGNYEYRFDPRGVFIINVSNNLVKDKKNVARSQDDCNKFCTDLGKTLYGKLMKFNDVDNVFMSNRQIAINKYPLPKDEKPLEKFIVDTLDLTLKK